MKVSFRTHSKKLIRFTARPSKKRCPKHLKKFQFKSGSRKQVSCLRKARTKLKRMGWRF